MYVQDNPVLQDSVHRRLNRGPQLVTPCIELRNFHVPPQGFFDYCEFNRNKSIFLLCVRQPFAGRLDPQNSIEL
jgi:hypothetical protein